jgi:hypothetical protein
MGGFEMRSRQGIVVALIGICGLAAMNSEACASVLNTAGDVFYGMPAVASSNFTADYTAAMAVDGKTGGAGCDMVFGNHDSNQRLVVYGFDSPLKRIRLWTDMDTLQPTGIGIRSSTSNNMSVDDAFATELVPMTSMATGDWTLSAGVGYYKEFFVNAPAGTESVLFSIQGSPYTGGDGFTRVCEVMGFTTIPEPATLSMAVVASVGLLAYAWRKRK